ncbi:hypothetical protein ACFL27_12100 [candidate division CSSED10-310 bacterium]|uniref:DUF1631 family protein n=1 Tax=candidate division CSSED10-310 bacterium TaxID=2855610 RepID=A0ABV6YXL1_UNCC1
MGHKKNSQKKESFFKRLFSIFRKKPATAPQRTPPARKRTPKREVRLPKSEPVSLDDKVEPAKGKVTGFESAEEVQTMMMDVKDIMEVEQTFKKEKMIEPKIEIPPLIEDTEQVIDEIVKEVEEGKEVSLFDLGVDDDELPDDVPTELITELKLSEESMQILSLTNKKFPVLVPFMENLLQWIEDNLGLGLLGNSLTQLYAADADFELEPDDFIMRFLQGVQINNLNPLFKIIYLRAGEHLDADLSADIITAVTQYERRIRTDRLVEIFPWQKRRAKMRIIIDKISDDKKNAVFNDLEKTTREKTKEMTIKKWLDIILSPDIYSEADYATQQTVLEKLYDEFKKSTAETQVLVVNIEEMMAQAEREKMMQIIIDDVTPKISDLQDRKTRLIENLYNILEALTGERLKQLINELKTQKDFDVFSLLLTILKDTPQKMLQESTIIFDFYQWQEELRIKEALKTMYFISRAYRHALLSKSLLILGCLTELDTTSYRKKVKKISSIYGFDLHKHLEDHPFNPNSTKAASPNGQKYTLQFEQKTIAGMFKEEMILYREGSILAKLIIPLTEAASKEEQDELEVTMSKLQRSAYGLETMINFYHSYEEIRAALGKNENVIWDDQGLQTLKDMIANKQTHFLVLDPEKFGLSAFHQLTHYGMGYIVGKLIDDIFIPLSKQVKNVLKF